MRNKALQDPKFPDQALLNEYLVEKDNVPELKLKWKQPDLISFMVSTLDCVKNLVSNNCSFLF